MRGERRNILTLAHQVEAMARTKRLPRLDMLLRDRSSRDGGDGRDVIAMFEAMAAKGAPVKITRVGGQGCK